MITSTTNLKIKSVRALQTQRRAREHEQAFVIEGVRLAEEAVRAHMTARLVLHTDALDARSRAALNQLARLGAPTEEVSPAVMAAASDTKTPAGLLAVIPFPALPLPPLAFVLVLDRIADPGNLGTLFRTAEAAGAQAVFLAPGTVDAYNPKVVRAAMGAHFHLPIVEADWKTLTQHLAGLKVWLAEARDGTAYDKVNWQESCALIVGAEAEGPSDAARQCAGQAVHIPMPGPAESLNAAVAAGVLLFEAARQRSQMTGPIQATG